MTCVIGVIACCVGPRSEGQKYMKLKSDLTKVKIHPYFEMNQD